MDICLAAARAATSRRNGAKSRGPRTQEGKTRSAQNALKHGLRAQKFVVVGDEDPKEFAALEAALVEELAPERALQSVLAGRIARAAWRLERAERLAAGTGLGPRSPTRRPRRPSCSRAAETLTESPRCASRSPSPHRRMSMPPRPASSPASRLLCPARGRTRRE
jgi:hypothetical protein